MMRGTELSTLWEGFMPAQLKCSCWIPHCAEFIDLQATCSDMNEVDRKELGVTGANMLIEASPWMARSWPLQEAALAPRI